MTCVLCAALVLFSGKHNDLRLANAYRVDDAGWIYLHLQGKPRDIGFQYGSLAGKEIDDAHRALKVEFRSAPYDWEWARNAAKTIFWPKLDNEYKEEIEGQAEGLKAKGFDYDQWDVLAFNGYIELQGYYIPYLQAKRTGAKDQGNSRESCSAFIATGGTTKDGKIVMGHNLWWDYLMGERCNLILDIEPEQGYRVMMDAFCGFIHSGSDFAVNSAGIVLCETTISDFTSFDPNGVPEFMRMRKAIQYGNSLDKVANIFKEGNNGGYANTWLMGDLNTNEIGKLELGLKNVDFVKKKNGYYVGSNFPENPKLISEEIVNGKWDADPHTNGCEERRLRWNTLLTENAGKVDATMAKTFLADTYDEVNRTQGASGRTLCGVDGLGGAVNTKVIDANMARSMRFWARMGISDGETFHVFENGKSIAPAAMRPYLRDMPTEPWIVVPVTK